MTPLEKALKEAGHINYCDECGNFLIVGRMAYCKHSGKLIHPIMIERGQGRGPAYTCPNAKPKAVLFSIKPEWCVKIVSGEKTIEVRKTCPNIQPPFKCYIYCTRGNQHAALAILPNGAGRIIACSDWKTAIPCGCYIGNGKVIGEYICDKIERYALMGTNRHDIAYRRLDAHEFAQDIDLGATCLSAEALRAYGAGKPLYGWHISQLKIYAKPLPVDALQGKRPPQSWVYVDELYSA